MKTKHSLLVLLALLAIGCGASQREKTLRAAFVATNSARDGFATFDRERQQEIIDKATSLEQGQAALVAYREKQGKIALVFEDVYRALTAAVLAEDTGSYDAAMKAAEKLKKALDDLKKVGVP
jgi:hypothetical protein